MSADDSGTPSAVPQVKPEGAANATPSAGGGEHLNIKVTDNNNEVFFRIRKTTALKKLMDTFCERQGKARSSLRFLYDGERINETDTPDALGMQDGDTLEVHQEQIGGAN
ncbi:ubiquitin-related domain-containing protein [Lipomyces kononenkoae]|uniref:Ubiquitin-related domain-containing protein n=1 Tax=Lipomyces kononenkoae TaxID=34357 RepID=A0ACC3SV19_LIPKO